MGTLPAGRGDNIVALPVTLGGGLCFPSVVLSSHVCPRAPWPARGQCACLCLPWSQRPSLLADHSLETLLLLCLSRRGRRQREEHHGRWQGSAPGYGTAWAPGWWAAGLAFLWGQARRQETGFSSQPGPSGGLETSLSLGFLICNMRVCIKCYSLSQLSVLKYQE